MRVASVSCTFELLTESRAVIGNLRACLLARIAVDFAHRGASGVVGCKPPVDAVVAVHATGKEVESFVVHVFFGKYQRSTSEVAYWRTYSPFQERRAAREFSKCYGREE